MGIYSKIIDMQKLGQAWDKVRKNKPACGIDHVTCEMFEEQRKEGLRQLNLELAEHRYESLPVKLNHIYKEEKVRTIALFSMRDKIVQQSVAYELGRIYEPHFSKCTYAYRPGQSALTALRLIEEKIKQHENLWFLKMDITDFFDSIQHDLLKNILKIHIHEDDVLELIECILKAPIFDEKTGELRKKEAGLYQGASCAPVLSNIYLMDYDKEMESRSSFYIRYSDDLLILEPTEEKAKEIFDYSRLYLEKKGLKLKESKTQICSLGEKQKFIYLGYEFTSQGKAIPQKAVSSLIFRLETMWLTSNLEIEEKIKKGQEILGGWEQYYREDRKIDSIIEYVLVLSMVQKKSLEIRQNIEEKRFTLINYYKDIAKFMVEYWISRENEENAICEYEQFFQVPDEEKGVAKRSDKLLNELLESYRKILIQPSEELYTDIMQIYTDMGHYKKASYFWEKKTKFLEEQKIAVPVFTGKGGKKNPKIVQIDIQTYMDLFVGREDTYVKETATDGRQRATEQVLEPLTEEIIMKHLSGDIILGTYVQRPNNTSKYLIFDIDISKKILLQYNYGSPEFTVYKQKAAEYTAQVCRILKKMGITGYIEDTGYRGYHIWVFFTEWIQVRYLNRLTDCVRQEIKECDDDIIMEFFPNSIRIRQGKTGQNIKLPLGLHIRTGEQSCFLDDQFQSIEDYSEFLPHIVKYSINTVHKILGIYALDIKEKTEIKKVEQNWERFGMLPETVKIVLEKCSLMRYLCQKAASTGYLSHYERMSVLYVFGHMGDEGKEFVHTVMGLTLNYQYNTTQKFIVKIPEKPVSCVKLREQYKLITAEYGCNCNFKRTKNCYPSPVLHAIKNSEEEQSEITVPVSRSITKAKEEKVYEEINIHRQTEKLAQRIVELKRQKRGLNKVIHKIETELQKIFDNAGIDCLEIEMGMLVRRKKGNEYEWLIEL